MRQSEAQQHFQVGTYKRRGRQQPIIGTSDIKMTQEMARLADIVASMNKDVKAVRKAMCFESAQEYAAKKGPGWNAYEADIIGDAQKEVFVTNPQGYLHSINGYRL